MNGNEQKPGCSKGSGRTVLITGSSRGIGLAMAQEFARDGWQVILNGRTPRPDVEETIRKISPDSFFLTADVSSEEEVTALFQSIKERKISLDALICCSGISRDALLLRMKSEDLDAMLDINLKSAFYCAKQASRLMLPQKKGSILFVSSVVGLCGHEGQCAYSASKAGLIGLAKSLARELGSRNIRVNAIAPGWIETDMTRSLAESSMPPIPLGRRGQPEEVAHAALFLSSENSSYITGQVLQVDGGMAM